MEGKVLIVENDPTVLKLATDFLQYDGHEVVTASDGEEGLQMFSGGGFDVVVTDVKMPKMDGIQMMKAMKALDSAIEVIVLTGFGTFEMTIEVIRNGGYENYYDATNDAAVVSSLTKEVKLLSSCKEEEGGEDGDESERRGGIIISSCDEKKNVELSSEMEEGKVEEDEVQPTPTKHEESEVTNGYQFHAPIEKKEEAAMMIQPPPYLAELQEVATPTTCGQCAPEKGEAVIDKEHTQQYTYVRTTQQYTRKTTQQYTRLRRKSLLLMVTCTLYCALFLSLGSAKGGPPNVRAALRAFMWHRWYIIQAYGCCLSK